MGSFSKPPKGYLPLVYLRIVRQGVVLVTCMAPHQSMRKQVPSQTNPNYICEMPPRALLSNRDTLLVVIGENEYVCFS